ncbi:MAG: CBS domain-containing protein [Candidatus Saliniplasma sp.]
MERSIPKVYDLNMPIRSMITKRVIGVEKHSSVQESAKKMVEFEVSSLVVVDDGEIVGFLTDGDIKKRVVAEGLSSDIPVKEVMSRNLVTVDIGTTVRDVLDMMADKNVKHVMVEEEGEIVGMLTFGDLIHIDKQKVETHISRE